jgi:hypothetical protein|tara:strand:- start:19 stop:426 length:408 start_codon:yes stop_codon:yes gene_type:complete
MIGDITRNLVEQFSDNFGSGNNISYASGGVRYSDRGAGAPPIVGIVTAGEKLSKSYSPAKLISVSNSEGDFSSEGKMFAAYSNKIKIYDDSGNEQNSSLLYQRFFFPGKTTLPLQHNNSMSVNMNRSNTRLSLRK